PNISTPSAFRLHHTPAPVISTLSLHDALPLSGPLAAPGAAGGGSAAGGRSAAGLAHRARLPRPLRVVPGQAGLHARQPRPAPPRDRKSTRLNSSHVKISYAFF